MFARHFRKPTAGELSRRPGGRSEKAANFGCAGIFFGIVPWFLLWRFFTWAFTKAGHHETWMPAALATLVAVPLCAWCFRKLAREMARSKMRGADESDAQVEEWHIKTLHALKLVPFGEDEPVLCFEAGPDCVVMLKGQWLWDEATYGAPRIKDDPDENYLNGLGTPYSFPCREFVVTRWPKSGRVLSIRPLGDYLPPEKSKLKIKRSHSFRSSEVFIGSLENLQGLLDDEARKDLAATPPAENPLKKSSR